jgi:hypothetical protein
MTIAELVRKQLKEAYDGYLSRNIGTEEIEPPPMDAPTEDEMEDMWNYQRQRELNCNIGEWERRT